MLLGASSFVVLDSGVLMGVSYTIESEIVVVTNQGLFDYRDVEAVLRAVVSDREFMPGMRVLFIDEGSQYSPPPHEPELASRMLGSFVPEISPRMAIVVCKDHHFGIARMMEIHCRKYGVRFKAFLEESGARSWLSE